MSNPLVLRPIEVKYQLSLKAKLWEDLLGTPLRVWGGYTQSSRWQVYNGRESRPFRETNYEPEVIFAWPLDHYAVGLAAAPVVGSAPTTSPTGASCRCRAAGTA